MCEEYVWVQKSSYLFGQRYIAGPLACYDAGEKTVICVDVLCIWYEDMYGGRVKILWGSV